MNLSGLNLPPGFRFHPTDEELILYYLEKKVSSRSQPLPSIIADIDLYKLSPWDLPAKAVFGETEWFFFTPRGRKYPNGSRPNRAAGAGYWKAAGTDKPILDSVGSQCIGVKKSLVFYKGRPPKSVKTNWVMHEYRLLDDATPSKRLRNTMQLDDWVLCRVRQKINTPQQTGDNIQGNILNSSPTVTLQYPEDQESSEDRNIPFNFNRNNSNMSHSSFGDPLQNIIDTMQEDISFQGGPTISDANSYVDSPLKDALESIKRTLSIDNFEGDQWLLPPHEMANIPSVDHIMDCTNSFQFSSSIPVSSPNSFRGTIY